VKSLVEGRESQRGARPFKGPAIASLSRSSRSLVHWAYFSVSEPGTPFPETLYPGIQRLKGGEYSAKR